MVRRVTPGQDRGPRDGADRGGDKALIEADALVGEPIQIRRGNRAFLVIHTQRIPTLIVCQQDQQVWSGIRQGDRTQRQKPKEILADTFYNHRLVQLNHCAPESTNRLLHRRLPTGSKDFAMAYQHRC